MSTATVQPVSYSNVYLLTQAWAEGYSNHPVCVSVCVSAHFLDIVYCACLLNSAFEHLLILVHFPVVPSEKYYGL